MIISGLCRHMFQELPLEFATKVNQLMSLKLKGSGFARPILFSGGLRQGRQRLWCRSIKTYATAGAAAAWCAGQVQVLCLGHVLLHSVV